MDVLGLLNLLRRRWLVVVLCAGLGLGAAIALTRSTPPVYQSTTRLFINIPGGTEVFEALQGVELSSNLLASYAEIATSRSVADRIEKDVDLPLHASQIQEHLTAVPEFPSLLLTISATYGTPSGARTLADTAADAFVETVQDLEAGRSRKIQPRVIDAAHTPAGPIEPRPRRNAIIGLALGLLAGMGSALLLETLDRSLRGPEELVRLTGRPLLAIVPRRKDFTAHPVVTAEDAGTNIAEAYRLLRTGVRFVDLDRPLKTVLVTSPSPGDGKTATATNLAVAIAQGGERVLLVDADLRRSHVPEVMGVQREPGLTSVLLGDSKSSEAVVGLTERLFVLPSGPLPPNPSELLGSTRMFDLLTELGKEVDVIVIDAPPVVPVTDAQVLAALVHGVIFVARDGRTSRTATEEAVRRLDLVRAPVVGCVLNAASASDHYVDDYGYAAYAPKPKSAGLLSSLRPGDEE
ncbi:MAG TPA: polysaccharide biosynthesis tyrosine autokinase [Acidimicrobiales bacterium]|nr:polysaccharide biosynthesis tyrosine autokinase [Acidimicrobiales bacterium]